jgi:fatty-acyl-CoA synthase
VRIVTGETDRPDVPERGPFGPIPLTPTAFIDRARAAFADRTATIGDGHRYTYRELADRCDRLAGGLLGLGVSRGDVVSVLSPNTNTLLEAHFAVPMAGAVLNALNTRLSSGELAYITGHAGARVLIVDHELVGHVEAIRAAAPQARVVVAGGPDDGYGALVADAAPARVPVDDELALLALNYTSGTTGRPKGVMYQHRGAYLQALAMVAQAGLRPGSVFLWTLPMFHCNGWCFPWAVTAAGATHVELRKVDPERIWDSVRREGVTHFNAAPTVLTALAYGPGADAGPVERPVRVMTGGAPPSPTLLARMSELNLHVTHLYGLTETYGPAVICDWQPEWSELPDAAQARLNARQGVSNLVGLAVRVVDERGCDVAADGAQLGEVVLRGNNVMLGYYRDPAATAEATIDGWFRTGDVGVMHPDGYIELRDRSKDVIISGGENIASIEIEQALASHPAVLECAVVAAPDETWGEVPVAFVTLHVHATATERELVEHVRQQIARFKAPRRIVFAELPKTATGKIQKFVLREQVRADAVRGGGVGSVEPR